MAGGRRRILAAPRERIRASKTEWTIRLYIYPGTTRLLIAIGPACGYPQKRSGSTARGGLEGRTYPWGDLLKQDGEHQCNIWQGKFPVKNNASDGYIGTAPVDAYKPNGYGLYNMSGNVWEWCGDWFSPTYHQVTSAINPYFGESTGRRSMRGGSYLCHRSIAIVIGSRHAGIPRQLDGQLRFPCGEGEKVEYEIGCIMIMMQIQDYTGLKCI